jgi:OTU domain-containing protein 3
VKFEEQVAVGGLVIRDIKGDGNCMFRAVADQFTGSQENHFDYRHRIVDFMDTHRDVFQPFFYEGDGTFDAYLSKMRRDGEWGGNLELQALSLCCSVNIIVHQLGARPWAIQHDAPSRTIHLSYHDGDHYASIRCVHVIVLLVPLRQMSFLYEYVHTLACTLYAYQASTRALT